MSKLVECIPNFSEGQRKEVIEGLKEVIEGVPGVILLDYSSDKSHNRSVFTFVGTPEGVKEAAFLSAKKAKETIDMTKHQGEHPRMGATDVIPFVPVKGVTMEECIELSKEVAERISKELEIPAYLYEESATKPERKNLAAVRRGQFEGMPEKLKTPGWEPDFGGTKIHQTAGVIAIGARMPLVAYNINLDTSDITIANNIAKIIRESGGGLSFVKSIGVMLEDKNIAQVSINMTNYQKTPLYRVFELVKIEAQRYGVGVLGSEIIGLTPVDALVDTAKYYLQIEGFDNEKQVLEKYLLQG